MKRLAMIAALTLFSGCLSVVRIPLCREWVSGDACFSDSQDALSRDGGVVEANTARSQGEEASGNADAQALGLDPARRDMVYGAVRYGYGYGLPAV